MNRLLYRAGLSGAVAAGLAGITIFAALAPPAAAQDTSSNANAYVSTYRGSNSRSGYINIQMPTTLAVHWQNTTKPGQHDPSSPAFADGVLYFGSGSHIYAVNAEDGTVKWQYPTADFDKSGQTMPGPFNCPPTVADGKVYIGGDDSKLYVLDASTGDLLWQAAAGGPISSAPLVDNGVVFFGSDDNYLYDVRTDNQQPAWGGRYKTTGPVTAAPMVADGFIYFADDSNVYGVTEDSARPAWTYRVVGGMTAPPVLDNGTIYVGIARTLTAIVARSGSTRWQAPLPSEPSTAATVGGPDGLIYVPTSDGHLVALDSRGNIRWNVDLRDQVDAAPLLTANVLYVATRTGTVYGIDPQSGATNWSYTIRPAKATTDATQSQTSITAALVAAKNTLYALSDDGTLTAFTGDAPDSVPPAVISTYPDADNAISGVNIPYQITVHDIGSGVRPDSASLVVDGKSIPVEYDPVKNVVEVKTDPTATGILGRVQQTLPTLPGGQHTAVLTITDWRGNKLVRHWAFVVDSKLNPADTTVSAPGTIVQGTQPAPAGGDTGDQGAAGGDNNVIVGPDSGGGTGAPGGGGNPGGGNPGGGGAPGGGPGGGNPGGGGGGGGTANPGLPPPPPI